MSSSQNLERMITKDDHGRELKYDYSLDLLKRISAAIKEDILAKNTRVRIFADIESMHWNGRQPNHQPELGVNQNFGAILLAQLAEEGKIDFSFASLHNCGNSVLYPKTFSQVHCDDNKGLPRGIEFRAGENSQKATWAEMVHAIKKGILEEEKLSEAQKFFLIEKLSHTSWWMHTTQPGGLQKANVLLFHTLYERYTDDNKQQPKDQKRVALLLDNDQRYMESLKNLLEDKNLSTILVALNIELKGYVLASDRSLNVPFKDQENVIKRCIESILGIKKDQWNERLFKLEIRQDEWEEELWGKTIKDAQQSKEGAVPLDKVAEAIYRNFHPEISDAVWAAYKKHTETTSILENLLQCVELVPGDRDKIKAQVIALNWSLQKRIEAYLSAEKTLAKPITPAQIKEINEAYELGLDLSRLQLFKQAAVAQKVPAVPALKSSTRQDKVAVSNLPVVNLQTFSALNQQKPVKTEPKFDLTTRF